MTFEKQIDSSDSIRKKKRLLAVLTVVLVIVLCAGISAYFNFLSEDARLERYLTLGQKYLMEEKYEEAIVAFEKAIHVDPESIEARLGIADAYICLEEYRTAIKYLKDVLELDDGITEAYMELANSYMMLKDADKAVAILELGYEKTKNDELKQKKEDIEAVTSIENQNQARKEKRVHRESVYIGSEDELVNYYIYEYDENGRKTKMFRDDSSENIYEYDNAGNMIKESEYFDGELSNYYFYEYDGDGNQIKNYYYYEGSLISYHLYHYDKKGNLTKDELYENNELFEYWAYQYDENGHKIKMQYFMCFDGTPELSMYTTYEYDKRGNERKIFAYGSDGTFVGYELNEFNEKGQKIRSNHYDLDILDEYTLYEYDRDGHLLKEIKNTSDGVIITTYEYE